MRVYNSSSVAYINGMDASEGEAENRGYGKTRDHVGNCFSSLSVWCFAVVLFFT